MKNEKVLIFLFFFLIINLAGCHTLQRTVEKITKKNITAVTPLPPYSGFKASITVADFDLKVAKATNEIGSGLREMLITALLDSNRFIVVERQESKVVAKDQESITPQKDKIKAADLIITAEVTEFEPRASGGRAGIGGGGGAGSGIFGGLLGESLNRAHMVLAVRIVDARTSEVFADTYVRGQAADYGNAVKGSFFSNLDLDPRLSGYTNTPMEKAIRLCVKEAALYIMETIPENYYRY